MRILLPLALVSLAWLGEANLAHAQSVEDDARARVEFQEGSAAYQVARYEEAAAHFLRAYELSHRTPLLYNLYLAHDRLGHLEQAIDFLQRYVDADPLLEGREAYVERIANLRERLAQQEAAPAATPPAPPVRDEGRGLPPATWASFILGGAGLITFGAFGALALHEDGELSTRCGSAATRTCTDLDVTALERNALIADIGLGVAVVGAVAGVLFLVLRPDEEAAIALAPWVTLDAAGASLRLSL